ncbi:MAG: hypothetical protein PHH54_03690 [Candidatus Nanoarchaeia archaeon]|nr:hypothetical protein [Candidatus Nanoarchaeia archaeon]MDD5741061.1 hypothetical protein [Candidatus Nanoarchaeia archaeon]
MDEKQKITLILPDEVKITKKIDVEYSPKITLQGILEEECLENPLIALLPRKLTKSRGEILARLQQHFEVYDQDNNQICNWEDEGFLKPGYTYTIKHIH